MAPASHEELAQACIANEWSKAIKILTSMLAKQPDSIQLLCNRAFCHNKLDLHKHTIKDCDKALQHTPTAFQAYLYKGHALIGLGKHQEALQVLKKGYEAAVSHPGNIEWLLELHKAIMIIEKGSVKEAATIEMVPQRDSSSALSTLSLPPKTPPRQDMQIDAPSLTQERRHTSSTSKRASHMITVDLRLTRGIGMVNNGKYQEAVCMFDQVIQDNPASIEALLGRGTAYAFLQNLEDAILDFSKAIQLNPQSGEAWKRRGQARAAIGENKEAITDLSKALEFEPRSSDILHERGAVQYRSKDYEGAVLDLKACISVDNSNAFAYSYLGLSLLATGYHEEGIKAHYKALELDPGFKEGWTQLAQSFKELGKTEKAMECLQKALAIDEKFVNAFRLLGALQHNVGDHIGAIKQLTAGLCEDPSNLECRYFRASCWHALGDYADAVKDYDAILDIDVDTYDKCILQSLAFYQRVVTLYTASRANLPFTCFNIDQDLHPSLKEAWCKKLRPSLLIASCAIQPPIKESLKGGRVRRQDFVISKAKRVLLETADQIGCKIQYNCSGFVKNKRQYRMAGLAILEVAQKVLNTWRAMREPWSPVKSNATKLDKRARRRENMGPVSHNRGGVCSSSDSPVPCSCHEDGPTSEKLILNWPDVYSIAVKWRQISEPCDPVVWVNKLSEKEFAAGFGSHTPMVLGQAQVVRYYPQFTRAFKILKDLMIRREIVYGAANSSIALSPMQLQAIQNVETCSEMYTVVGEDFWAVTPCQSIATEGKILDGTRLTLQRGDSGFDFSIRTPSTPQRWADYEHEMSAAWEALCNICCWEAYGSADRTLLEKVGDCILRLTFYWYNFMPLARGTAVVGYVTLLGLFLAAGIEITADIPEGLQVDWEAILSPEVSMFMQSVKPWLYSSIKLNDTWQSLPNVESTFLTTGSVVAALSNYSN